MDSIEADQFLYNSKIIHLMRHAQGLHNVAAEKNYSALSSPEFFDAPLSSNGWQQIQDQRNCLLESRLLERVDLVITSPLLRSMQTAVEIFGSEISGLNRPPIIAVELCRERLGVHPCDKRKNIGEYRSIFPEIDFSLIESEEDILWKADVRETGEEIAARGLKFMNWLWTRQEREIVVVSHNRFLQYTTSVLANGSNPSLRSELCKLFDNCELRSLVMIDKRVEALIPQLSYCTFSKPSFPYFPSEMLSLLPGGDCPTPN